MSKKGNMSRPPDLQDKENQTKGKGKRNQKTILAGNCKNIIRKTGNNPKSGSQLQKTSRAGLKILQMRNQS